MSNNNDDNNSNLQLFDWLLTNPILDMTTTALPVNNVPGNEAIGNVNSLQALFDSPLPEVMSFSPLQAIPSQQQQLDGLSLSNSTRSIFNTPLSSTTMPVMNHTPGTQSTSSPSPDERGSSNSGGSMSDVHLHQEDESSSGRARQQEDQTDHPSESELKKMTSKERRQLRNKISARKFRSRKKGKELVYPHDENSRFIIAIIEYVTTLENDLQRQKHENERLSLEVSFIRENADKLQKERDDLKLQLALCREKNRELMRRLDKGGSSSSSSSSPPENNNDNNPSSSSSSFNESKSPNAPDLDISLLSADKIHSSEKSLPTEIAVASSTITDNSNIAPPSPPSSPKHHTHSTSKSYQQDITVHNNNNSSDNLSSLPNNPSLTAALIWILLGYGMTLLASQDYVYRNRSLPPSSSTDNTNRSRTHSKPSVMNLRSTTIAQRPIRKIFRERQCISLEQQLSSQPIHSHQSIYQHSHQTYSQSSSVVK